MSVESSKQDPEAKELQRKEPGEINLVRLFEAEAIELLAAAERGRVLHRTKNIRESGGPLEASFRRFLKSKLPTGYRTMTGYLFDVESKCTPQIDAMVIDANECHELMTSAEGAGYVPFTGVLTVAEIKNTTSDICSSLNQASRLLEAIASMRRTSKKAAELPKVLSIACFASSANCNLSKLQSWYASQPPTSSPTYLVLLDRGVVVAFSAMLDELSEQEGPRMLGFRDHMSHSGKPYLYMPRDRADGNRRGRALLWIYLAIADHLSTAKERVERDERDSSDQTDRRNRSGHIRAFTESAERAYALEQIVALESATDWPATCGLPYLEFANE